MTLNEAIELANSGDHNAIRLLGGYYFNGGDDRERDYDESLKWYTFGAENGYTDCMLMASLVGTMLAHALRKIAGSDQAYAVINELIVAHNWAVKAFECGVQEAQKEIGRCKGELGIAYYLAGLYEKDNPQASLNNIQEGISMFNDVYKTTDDKEVLVYYAFALHEQGKLIDNSREDNELEYYLLSQCVDNYFDEIVNAEVASFYLGLMYMEGCGCKTDYDKAVHYFQIAHNAGLDCSDILKHFKKKLFGGYTLID